MVRNSRFASLCDAPVELVEAPQKLGIFDHERQLII
jgi:hypothetical protein